MSQGSKNRGQGSGAVYACLLLACLLFASPLFADSKDESLRPLDSAGNEAAAPAAEEIPADPALEQQYRAELERRLDQERESYKGSLTSLWLANVAVWGCLIAFMIFQAISARKRNAELERLKAQREAE